MKRSHQDVEKGKKRQEEALSGATWQEREHLSRINNRRQKSSGKPVTRLEKSDAIELSHSLLRRPPDEREFLYRKLDAGFNLAGRQGRSGIDYDMKMARDVEHRRNPMLAKRHLVLECLHGIDESSVPDTASGHVDPTTRPPHSPVSLIGLQGAQSLQASPAYARLEGMLFKPYREWKRDPKKPGFEEPIAADCNINRIVRSIERDGGSTLFEVNATLHETVPWVGEMLGSEPNAETILFSLDFMVGPEARFLLRFLYGKAYTPLGSDGKPDPTLVKLRELLGDKPEVPTLSWTRAQFLGLAHEIREGIVANASLTFLAFYYHVPHRGYDTLYDKIQDAAMRREEIIIPSGIY